MMDSPVPLHYAAGAAKRCSEQDSARTTHPYIVVAMAYCSYCDEWAVIDIPANPSSVCLEHAVEFWTGLLTYARQRSEHSSEPLKTHAACAICKELSATRARAIDAVDVADPAPAEAAAARPLRLASARRTPKIVRIAASQWGGMSRPMSRG
jgi:hypothetical protein